MQFQSQHSSMGNSTSFKRIHLSSLLCFHFNSVFLQLKSHEESLILPSLCFFLPHPHSGATRGSSALPNEGVEHIRHGGRIMAISLFQIQIGFIRKTCENITRFFIAVIVSFTCSPAGLFSLLSSSCAQ